MTKVQLKVSVTDKDIAKGMSFLNTGDECPYGLAINRALKEAGLGKLRAEIGWGGEVWISGKTYYPQALKSMPRDRFGDTYTQDQIAWISTKRKFVMTIEVD